MTEQTELFDVGPREKVSRPVSTCTPEPIGSGPAGETCGTCRHKTTMPQTAGRYLKCHLVERYWTRGAGTDIKARWPACTAGKRERRNETRTHRSRPAHG